MSQMPIVVSRGHARFLISGCALLVAAAVAGGCADGSGSAGDDAAGAAAAADQQPAPQAFAVHRFTLHPELPWQSTGISLQAGQQVTLQASGKYVFHADGYDSGAEGIPEAVPFLGSWPAPNLTGLALIGKIGEAGAPFLVGQQVDLEAPQAGELYLMVNDDILDENSGTLAVEVTVAAADGDIEMSAASSPPVATADALTGETLEIPGIGLRMVMPAGWQPGGISGDSVLASYSAGPGLYPGLNITLEDRGDRSLDEACDDWLSMLTDLSLHQRQERVISGAAGLFVDASWSSPLGSLRALRLFVQHGEDVVVITFADRASGLDATGASHYDGYLQTVSLQESGARP